MTDTQRELARKYLIYKIFSNLWFLSAVWLYFYRLFINDQQVGILDGVAFAIGLFAEVPSGALADKFGRDKIVRLGNLLCACGWLIQVLGQTFPLFILGQAITMIGFSFVSGADDALFYENLKFDENTTHWKKLTTRGTQAGLVASIFAIIAGGYLHSLNPMLPWLSISLSFILATISIWSVKDNRIKRERQKLIPEVKDYLNDIRQGFAQFLSPNLSYYVPFILTVQGLFYTAGFGLLRLVLLDRFRFSSLLGSVAIASSSLITVGVLTYLHRHADRFSERRILTVIGLTAAAGLLLSLADIGLWGYAVILVLYLGEHIAYPIMSDVLNRRAPEERRATVLSVASFLRTLPYVILAPIIGSLNSEGKLDYFLVTWAALIFVAVMIYLLWARKDIEVKIEA